MGKQLLKPAYLACALLAGSLSCLAGEAVPRYGYKVVKVYPHDTQAFTQGLKFHRGDIFESTGQYGESQLRRVALSTGEVVQRKALPARYFGEGIEILGKKVYQLTWRSKKVFIYDLETFAAAGSRRITTEGWGLAYNGEWLIVSDGSNRLQYLNPGTFVLHRSVKVTLNGKPLTQLNELEFIKGEIWANVWRTDTIARIDPDNGQVVGVVDLSGLSAHTTFGSNDGDLNGIAWDPAAGRLFVTGKNWANLFEIELVAR